MDMETWKHGDIDMENGEMETWRHGHGDMECLGVSPLSHSVPPIVAFPSVVSGCRMAAVLSLWCSSSGSYFIECTSSLRSSCIAFIMATVRRAVSFPPPPHSRQEQATYGHTLSPDTPCGSSFLTEPSVMAVLASACTSWTTSTDLQIVPGLMLLVS